MLCVHTSADGVAPNGRDGLDGRIAVLARRGGGGGAGRRALQFAEGQSAVSWDFMGEAWLVALWCRLWAPLMGVFGSLLFVHYIYIFDAGTLLYLNLSADTPVHACDL